MKKKTIKQRNIELLQSKGWTEDTTTRVTRYTVYSKPGVDYHYYLGRSGACRRGRTVGNSISVKLKIDSAPVKEGPLNPLPKSFIKKMADKVLANVRANPPVKEDEQRPDPTAFVAAQPAASSDATDVVKKETTSPLADLLQRSVEITRLDTPALLKVRCEDPDQEVRKVAHHELVKRGYTGGNQMVEAHRKEVAVAQ